MISVICFILPILLWILTFPIKATIKTLELSLKAKDLGDRLKGKGSKPSLLNRLENWANEDVDNYDAEKKVAQKTGQAVKTTGKVTAKATMSAGKMVLNAPKNIFKTIRTTGKIIKATKTAVKVGVKATRLAIQVTIRTLKALIVLIKSLITFLVSLGFVGIVILIIIVVILIVCIVVVIISMSVSKGSAQSASTGGGNFSGYDYLSIDWTQDFSAKLAEVESTHGVRNRHYAELVIMSLSTMQTHEEITLDATTWIGIKKVESTVPVFNNDNPAYSVFDSYSDVEAYDNGYGCFGPFQINTKDSLRAWTLYNAEYQATKGSPYGGSRDTTYGNIYFYPDLCLGTSVAHSKSIASWMQNSNMDRGYNGIYDDLKTVFSEAGVECTDDKAKKIFECLLSNAYNVGHVTKLTDTKYKAMVKLYIKFFETYGWERNENQVNMILSTVNAGKENPNIWISADFYQWVWGGDISGSGNYANEVSVGLLDATGNPISKTLYGYLSEGDDSIRSVVPTFSKNSNENIAQYCYGMAVYFSGTWQVEKTIDFLGLRDQLVVSDGEDSVVSGEYSNKIWQIAERVSKKHPVYKSPAGRDGENAFDCSALVHRALIECGYDCFNVKASDHEGYKTESKATFPCGSTHSEEPWVRSSQPQSIIFDVKAGESVDFSKLEVGDVFVGTNHTVFFMGKKKSGEGYLIFHASSANPSSFTCYDNPEQTGEKYGVGWGTYSDRGWTLVYRPSLFK